MARIIVVGGRGFYGARVVERLRSLGHDVVVASRSGHGSERVDLCDSATFGRLDDADVVVNCSDSVGAHPGPAMGHVLRRGGVWMEMGADRVVLEGIEEPTAPKGAVVLGVGVFPGLSTLLAREAVARSGLSAVDLVIRFSPLSGAGRANCALMAHSLFQPVRRVSGGALEQGRGAAGRLGRHAVAGRSRATIEFGLPDVELIHRATRADSVSTWFALVPGVLRVNFWLLSGMCRLLRPLQGLLIPLLTWQMVLLRAVLLRSRASSVELAAHSGSVVLERHYADGQESTAAGVVGAVSAWLAAEEGSDARRPGVFGVAERFSLAEVEGPSRETVTPEAG